MPRKPPAAEEDEGPVANSAEHEEVISGYAKHMVAPFLHIALVSGEHAKEQLENNNADPLATERFLHLADLASQIAHRVYTLGEDARERCHQLYLKRSPPK